MKPVIHISINADGEVTLKVQGAKGAGCKKLTAELENKFGTPSKRTLLPEFYEQEENRSTTHQIKI